MAGTGVFLVTIPADITLVVTADRATGAILEADVAEPDAKPDTVSKFEFVRHFVVQQILRDPAWSASMEDLYTSMEIRGIFKPLAPGDVAEVTKEQRAKVMDRLKAPHPTCRPAQPILMHFRPWYEAFEKAPEKGAT